MKKQKYNTMEDQCIEYKSVWRDDYLKWLCGFANAGGGVLYVGKNDSGEVVGVDDAKRLLEDLPNKIRSTMGMLADVSLHSEEDKDFIKVDITPYPSPISYHGKYYLRSGATNQELTGNALDEFMLRKQGRTWDSVPVPYIKADDFDRDAFRLFREKAILSGRLTKEDVNISDAELLESLSLTENDYLKRAAILTFYQRPTKWFLGAYVKIGYFRTEADLVYQDEINGSILAMPDKVIDLIYTKYLKGNIRYEGTQRIDEYPVPKGALKEAVLNAIVHRDYSTGIPIQIKVYDNKIIIYNDGILPDNWDINDLLNAHRSRPHNPFVANAFFRSGQIESWGRGIDRIKEECQRFGTEEPNFKSKG
jgi:ATP-dependent DNA helicase RecG